MRRNKIPLRVILLAGLAVVGAGAKARAQAAVGAGTTWTAGAAVASQYLFRGLRLGGPALQPYVEGDGANYAIGVWASTPLKDKVPGRSDPELDPYGWYRWSVNEAVSLQPGFTVYTYPHANRSRGFYRATFEPSLALNYTIEGLVLTPKVYYDFTLRGATAELNAAYAMPLRSLGTELDLNASAGSYEWRKAVATATPAVKNWGDYWQVGATIPYQIKSSRVSLGLAYSGGERNYLKQGSAPKWRNPLAARRLVATLTYSYSW